MNVCHDWALRSWILGWGALARVLVPAIAGTRDRSRSAKPPATRYVPALD